MKYLYPLLIALLMASGCEKKKEVVVVPPPGANTPCIPTSDSGWQSYLGEGVNFDSNSHTTFYPGIRLSLSKTPSVSGTTKYIVEASCNLFTAKFPLPDSLVSSKFFKLEQQVDNRVETMYINFSDTSNNRKVQISLTWTGPKGNYGKSFASDE